MTSKANNSDQILSHKRWTSYTAAGAASVVALIGSQETAEAFVTVVDVNQDLTDRTPGDGYFDVFGPYTFGAAGASFVFTQALFNAAGTNGGLLTVTGAGNISFVGSQAGAYFYPSNLAYGANIATGSFAVTASNRGDMAWGGGYTNSQFVTPGTSYLGFRFDLGGGTQYGWAEVTMDGAPRNTGMFERYAYGSVGEEITVGETPPPVPLPGSLGMLALGCISLGAWRRKRAA